MHGKKRETGNNEFINRFNRTLAQTILLGIGKRTEAIKLIQEMFRLSAHILMEHPDQLIPSY